MHLRGHHKTDQEQIDNRIVLIKELNLSNQPHKSIRTHKQSRRCLLQINMYKLHVRLINGQMISLTCIRNAPL